MALVVSNALLIRFIWSKNGVNHAINVLGATGLGPSAVNQALADTIGTNVKGLWTTQGGVTLVPPTFTLDKVGVRSIGAANQPEFLDSGAAVAGTGTGNYLPPQTAFVVTLRTALAGKSYRGRIYYTGFTAAMSDTNGLAGPGVATALVNFTNALRTGQFGAALALSVVSRSLNQATPVTGVQSRNLVWETQRRRALAGI